MQIIYFLILIEHYLNTKSSNPDDNKNKVDIFELSVQQSIKHVPILHSSAVDLIKQLHKHEGREHHGLVLSWPAHAGLFISIPHVQEIRKYKHQ